MNADAASSDKIAMKAIVVRCGCGNPDSHNGVQGPKALCPQGTREPEYFLVAAPKKEG